MDPIHHYRVPHVKIRELHRAGDDARLVAQVTTTCSEHRHRFRDRLTRASRAAAGIAERAGPRRLRSSGTPAVIDGPDVCAAR